MPSLVGNGDKGGFDCSGRDGLRGSGRRARDDHLVWAGWRVGSLYPVRVRHDRCAGGDEAAAAGCHYSGAYVVANPLVTHSL